MASMSLSSSCARAVALSASSSPGFCLSLPLPLVVRTSGSSRVQLQSAHRQRMRLTVRAEAEIKTEPVAEGTPVAEEGGEGLSGGSAAAAGSTGTASASSTSSSSSSGSNVEAPAGFVAGVPRVFALGEGQALDILTAALGPLLRLGVGAFTTSYSVKVEPASAVPSTEYAIGPILGRDVVESSSFPKRPQQPIILYEFEGCPFCRKVREAVSALDLDVLYYPCPQGSPKYRPEAIALGGKKQFPYMVDPNTGVSMYESNDIIKYLADTYGDGTVPLMLRLGAFTDITAGFASIARIGKGSRYTPAKCPEQPLELWAYEASPFCKVVREVLVELELPHIYHSCARGSAKRSELKARTGRFQVPYLEDPNTGVKTFESKTIVDYLTATYALPPAAA